MLTRSSRALLVERGRPLPETVIRSVSVKREAARAPLLSCYHAGPMPLQVLQRPNWAQGTPIQLGDLFRLHKNRRGTRAALFAHQLGWEIRLLVGSQLRVKGFSGSCCSAKA